MRRIFSNKKGFSLDRLQTLVKVAEAGSLIRAAGGSETKASQFSRQLRELESFFGLALVRSRGRELLLTAEGNTLAALARDFLGSLDDFGPKDTSATRRLSLGAGDAFIQWLVIPRLESIRESFPKLRFEFRNLQNFQIVNALNDRAIDFGIIRRQSLRAPLESAPLGKLSYCLAVPERLYTKAPHKDLDWLLSNLPMAAQSDLSYAQRELEQAAALRRLKLCLGIQCDSFPDALAALNTGHYTALLPRLPGLKTLLPGARLLEIDFLETISCEIVLAWNPRILELRPDSKRLLDGFARHLAWH